MMNYVIYAAAVLLLAWSVWYVARTVRRQLRGECSCGGDCSSCGADCGKRKK